MEVEIMHKENVKPSSRTPQHLRYYKLSLLDQLCSSTYVPCILYYPSNQNTNPEVISERLQHLRQSLSETLTRFYPFAGRLMDNFSIDCNDEGVYYVEARMYWSMSHFLSHPDYQLIYQLVPHKPYSVDLELANCILMVQVTTFTCGGIVICTSNSHKLMDGRTCIMFLKAWAATTRGSREAVYPSFIAPSLFPQSSSVSPLTAPKFGQTKSIARRFVFDAKALAALKTIAASSSFLQQATRVEVVSALLWKCSIKAFGARHGKRRPSVFVSLVDLRRKSSPPLPDSAIGNIFWTAVAKYTPEVDLNLPSMIGLLRDAVTEINEDFFEEIKGDQGIVKINECHKRWGELFSSNGDVDNLGMTSICHSSIYETDFGWGKPLWFNCNAGVTNMIHLMDTRTGNGIEACVMLNEEDMNVFHHDPELLAFTSKVHPTSLL